MRIQPLADGAEWILVENYRIERSQGITGSSSGSSRSWPAWDKCWAGNRWASQRTFAQKFATREEATEYLDMNRETMEESA